MPTSYKGQFVKGGKKTSSHAGKNYDAGQGKPHLSGKDLHKRDSKELSEAGRGGRNAISDKYLREAINVLVSAGAKPDNYGSSGAIADAAAIKEQASKLAEEHLQVYRKKEYTTILDEYGNKVKVAKSKATEGEDYSRPIVKRAETRGLKDKLSTNLKEFINNYVTNKLKDAKPVETKKSGKKEKPATKDKVKTKSTKTKEEFSEKAIKKTIAEQGIKTTREEAIAILKANKKAENANKSGKYKPKEVDNIKSSFQNKTESTESTKVVKSKYALSDLNDKNKITAVTFAVTQTQNKSNAYNVSVDANGNAKFSLIKGKSDPDGKEKKSLQKTFESKLEDKVDGLRRAELYIASQKKTEIPKISENKLGGKKVEESPLTRDRGKVEKPVVDATHQRKTDVEKTVTKSKSIKADSYLKEENKKINLNSKNLSHVKNIHESLKGTDISYKSKIIAKEIGNAVNNYSSHDKFKADLVDIRAKYKIGNDNYNKIVKALEKNTVLAKYYQKKTFSTQDKIKALGLDKQSTTSNKDGNSIISSANKLISENKKSNIFSGRRSIESMGTKYNSLTQNSDVRNVLKSRRAVSKKYPVKIELDSEGYVKDIKLTVKGKKEKFNLTEQVKSSIALRYYGEVRSYVNSSYSKSLSRQHVENFGKIPKKALDIDYYIREKGMTYSQALKKVQNKKKRK